MPSSQRTVLNHAVSVSRHMDAFHGFRDALIQAHSEANGEKKEPGCDWAVGELGHSRSTFEVHFAGLRLRYAFAFAVPTGATVDLHLIDRYDVDRFKTLATEAFDGRGKTSLRFTDDGDELFLNTPAGAREILLVQVGRHLQIVK